MGLSIRRSEDIFLENLAIDVSSIIKKALNKIEYGEHKKAFVLLEPLLKKQEASAIYYASCFSLPDESIEDFDKRRIKQLQCCVNLGYVPAMHELAIHYDNGELVSKNVEKAALLFKLAAENGHPHSQWIYGLDLLYGTNSIEKNQSLGIDYIKKSADFKFEGALETMIELHEEGKYGFPIDRDKAVFLKKQLDEQDIIAY